MHLVWFRQDLRVADNAALYKACQNAEGVIGVFVVTPKTWLEHDFAPIKVNLILRQLEDLSKSLANRNIPLKIINVADFDSTPKALANFCIEHNIKKVFASEQILHDEAKRDAAVTAELTKINITFETCYDNTVMHPQQTLKDDGTPFKVFTPFKRKWLNQFQPNHGKLKPTPGCQKLTSISPDKIPTTLPEFKLDKNLPSYPTGEQHVIKILTEFCNERMQDYKILRDHPGLDGTSKISAYINLGIISPRQCLEIATTAMNVKSPHDLLHDEGCNQWLTELIWREFYISIAYHFPQVVLHYPFKPETDQLPWRDDEADFKAWCEGKTGFPIVDAAMRCLNATGWMHNRLRMIVAMFFAKTLFLDWRLGEQYFMQNLVDGDFCSNNGGWQWSASTGTDSVPYFRIFNPTLQSEKFDKEGKFIRQWLPELRDCSNKDIHNPLEIMRDSLDYPRPIVDYKAMRSQVIDAFKSLK